MRFGVLTLSLLMLGGCLGTPESPMSSDVELAENAPDSGLMATDVKAPKTALPKLQSVEAGADASVSGPEKPRRGLAALFGRRNKPATDTVPVAVDEEAVVKDVPDVENAAEVAGAVDTAKVEGGVDPAPEPVAQTPRRGLRALFGKRNRATNPEPEPEQAVATIVSNKEGAAAEADESVVIAPIDTQEAVAPRRERKGLFGPRRAKTGQFSQVEPDMVLPFGQIGLACGVRGKALGKEVDRFPEHGKGYRLFDTKPSTTGPRTHYITGFKDGCARQFTASLALLGSPVLHEQLLSVGSSQGQHSTNADHAFQKIRAKVCRVGKGKACPEKRIDEMEKSMAFVTIYERFGGNAKWNEILLHNGVVAAY